MRMRLFGRRESAQGRPSACAAVTAAFLLLSALAAAPAAAEPLQEPAGPVLLTIKGAIKRTNGPGIARFDREMLRALPRATLQTRTPWTRGRPVFEGVSFADLLKAVEADGDTILASALNDYRFEFAVDDALSDGAIVADHMNGERLTVRTKGPLWVIFPVERYEGSARQEVANRMVWQLNEIQVR